ncbi:radical SAM protein [Streptomyces sp. NBC_00287]|uniref:B12-binding domain-containing radical SAM protein n=1 Tax=Streptomyces sp. NBC_00287 TaxID=2975702 RepID=UPI002E29C32A|nr:radical SAM protein [Streptomyces sp. NBC_00287]
MTVDPTVSLVFPPLVETSLGGYYPSLAMLDGWLLKHGVISRQADLNAEFAEFILAAGALSDLATGVAPNVAPDSLPAALARWAQNNADQLIDAHGVFHFGRTAPLGYVMEEIARPFLLDPTPEELFGLAHTEASEWARQWHSRFMQSRRWDVVLPQSVRLLGISVPMGPQIIPALLMAEAARAAGFSGRIILGGPALSLMDDDDLERLLRSNRAVDAVVRFDGEMPLLKLAQQTASEIWVPADVAGCTFIDEGGAFTVVPPGPGLRMSELVCPRYDEDILRRIPEPVFSVTQARGCYWGKCDYCDFVELYDGSPPYRGRQPNAVVEEMIELNRRYGATKFTLVTESIPPAFARRMSSALLARELRFQWDSFAMVDRRFDAELLQLMADAGCTALIIGMETMVSRVLKLVHKSADREENIRFLREARDTGIKLGINLIPDLPSTTYEEAISALSDIKQYSDCIDSVSVFPFEATKSSKVGRSPENFGLIVEASSLIGGQAQYTLNNAGLVDPAMTPHERMQVHEVYNRFSRELNRERAEGATSSESVQVASPQLVEDRPSRMFRFAVEEFDWHVYAELLTVTQVRRREVARISHRIDGLVEPLVDGRRFSFSDFQEVTRLGRQAGKLLGNLIDAGIVMPVEE